MAKIRFTEIIDASLEWTTTVLFRPFNVRKWLILTFAALLAGYICGSIPNLAGKGNGHESKKAVSCVQQPQQQSAAKVTPNPIITFLTVAGVIFLIIALFILLIWLYARFSFVFLEDTVKNDGSLRRPFKSNSEMANSLFIAVLILTVIFLSIAGFFIFAFIKIIMRYRAAAGAVALKGMIFSMIPTGILLLLTIIIMAIISVIIRDIAVVIMYRDRAGFLAAFKMAISIIRLNKGKFGIYILILMGLGLCSSILYGIVSLAAVVGLIFPAGIVAGLFYLIYLALPAAVHNAYFIILLIICAPVVAAILYALTCLYLPIAVFFRALSLKFVARLAPEYNLFIIQKENAL